LAPPVVYRGVADAFVEQRAERTQTLEADFETNVGHADAARAEQLFGFLNSSLNQVLPWRGVEGLAKRT